jgi:hypothetical protein
MVPQPMISTSECGSAAGRVGQQRRRIQEISLIIRPALSIFSSLSFFSFFLPPPSAFSSRGGAGVGGGGV